MCINGFIQPQPFLTRYYPQLTESVDGLADRLLISFPKTHILMEEVDLHTSNCGCKFYNLIHLQEVDEWSEKLQSMPLKSLAKSFEQISKWHSTGEHVYAFSAEGAQVYKTFANGMAQAMNDQWEIGEEGNSSKDKRTMIRYSS